MSAMSALTKHEAAELVNRSTRWVEQNLPATAIGTARNGRPDKRIDVADLPADAQKAWAAKDKVVPIGLSHSDPGQLALQLTAPVGPNLSEADRKEAEHRYSVIEPLLHPDRYPLLQAGYPTKGALTAYICQQHQIGQRTLYTWLKSWKDGGLPALVSRDRSDKGQSRVLNAAAKDFLLSAALPRKGVYGVLSVREIFRAYEEERLWRASHAGKVLSNDFDATKYARYLDEDGKLRDTAQLPQVSRETFRIWFNRIPEIARTMAREGEEAFRNSQEIISFRELTAIAPLEYVVMDHRVLDIFCLTRTRAGWKLLRPWLTAAIDMRTRKWLAWVIVETPSSDSIAAVLKRVFLDHGLPTNLYWDNGKDFRCEWFEGKTQHHQQSERVGDLDPTWRGVLGTLGIRVTHAIVRNARAKIIEPNFGRISKFDETLPEFCGHKPTDRPEVFHALTRQHEKWMEGKSASTPFRTIQQVAALYTDAINDLNERPLEGEGMNKVTPTGHGWWCPNEAWEILTKRIERRTIDANLLHFCFAKRREVTVKHGTITTQFDHRDYRYRLTANEIALMALNGQTVEFAYDPLDLGEAAVYYQDRFVGLAHCVELRRMGEQDFVEDEKNRRAARREVKKFIEAVHAVVPVASSEARLERRQAVVPSRTNAQPPSVTIPAALPESIIEAEKASQADRATGFEAPLDPAQAPAVLATPAAEPDNDDEFCFFRGN